MLLFFVYVTFASVVSERKKQPTDTIVAAVVMALQADFDEAAFLRVPDESRRTAASRETLVAESCSTDV